MPYTIITRPGCKYCNQAKMLLSNKNLPFNEMIVGEHVTRENVIATYPTSKTLPIIELDGQLIGGYEQLIDHLNPPLEPKA